MPVRPKSRSVLRDHKKLGSRFVPPFLQHIPRLRDPEWVDRLVPELLWIALIIDAHGLATGPEVVLSTTRALRRIRPEVLGIRASEFSGLSPSERSQLAKELGEDGRFSHFQSALSPLLVLYPTCPMRDACSPIEIEQPNCKRAIKSVLAPLINRWSREATLVQATILYVAAVCDVVKMMNIPGFDLRAIADFPKTGASKIAAAVARTTTTTVLARADSKSSVWATEFWNRGFEIDPCTLGDLR